MQAHNGQGLEPETYYNKRTGQTHQGIAGIDSGFEYNVGKSRRQQLDTAWAERDRVFAGTMEPAPGSTPAAAFDPTGPARIGPPWRRRYERWPGSTASPGCPSMTRGR